MRLHYVQHVPFENPGSILAWADTCGCQVTCTRVFERAAFPNQEDFDWLVVMGGPMNVHEETSYPWLIQEKSFIRDSLDDGKIVIGLCLGAQLIADILGGVVESNGCPEIGWFPVRMLPAARASSLFDFLPEHPVVFQWHGDTFRTLPEKATLLATGELCRNQAFMYDDRVFGFQFHLENTGEIIAGLVENCRDELIGVPSVQSAGELLSHPEHVVQDNAWMDEFLSRLADRHDAGGI